MKVICNENFEVYVGSWLFFFHEGKEYDFEKIDDDWKLNEGQMGQLSSLIKISDKDFKTNFETIED
jgi:hypothetical protein